MTKATIEVFDLSQFPSFNKYSVGYEDIFRRLQVVDRWANSANKAYNAYPPYNIEQTSDNEYMVSLAVAGFNRKEVTITTKNNRLNIVGEKDEIQILEGDAEQTAPKYVHKGIATRNFELFFDLADHIEVKSATFIDGLLAISLERVVPEALKERVIKIK